MILNSWNEIQNTRYEIDYNDAGYYETYEIIDEIQLQYIKSEYNGTSVSILGKMEF